MSKQRLNHWYSRTTALLLLVIVPCSTIASTTISATNQAGQAGGDNIQSRESIRDIAADYARDLALQHGEDSDIEIVVGQLDKRLRLAACSQQPEAFASPNTRAVGRTTVGVRCDGDKSWKLYVAVDIQVMRPVAKLSRSVSRNTMLQAADIAMSRENIAALHKGYFSSVEALAGKFTKNPLTAGTVLTPAHVKNPLAVKKGSLVTIVANVGGIEVRMKGKALKSGALGDWVSVKNVSSKRQIEGRVTDAGVIQVTL